MTRSKEEKWKRKLTPFTTYYSLLTTHYSLFKRRLDGVSC